jgi:hypothetical protein
MTDMQTHYEICSFFSHSPTLNFYLCPVIYWNTDFKYQWIFALGYFMHLCNMHRLLEGRNLKSLAILCGYELNMYVIPEIHVF